MTSGLSLIDTEFRRWERLLARLGPADHERPLFDADAEGDRWVIRDVVTHIAAWKRNTTRVARLRQEGRDLPLDQTPDETLGIDDVDAFNQEVRRRWRERSFDDALAEHRAAHAELVAALRGLPEEKIPPRATGTWLYPATWHPRLHRLHVIDALDPL